MSASTDPREIERKFLVTGAAWRKHVRKSTHIVQGYLARGRKATVRIRIKNDRIATMTVKSREPGMSRAEFEYRIPLKHARAMLALCGNARIEKERHEVAQGRRVWEIDVFTSPHAGLVVAEIELDTEDEDLALPVWIGREVTDDPTYRNSALVEHG